MDNMEKKDIEAELEKAIDEAGYQFEKLMDEDLDDAEFRSEATKIAGRFITRTRMIWLYQIGHTDDTIREALKEYGIEVDSITPPRWFRGKQAAKTKTNKALKMILEESKFYGGHHAKKSSS